MSASDNLSAHVCRLQKKPPKRKCQNTPLQSAATLIKLSRAGESPGTSCRKYFRRNPLAGSEICALLRGCAPNVYHRSMIIVPHGAPEGYEWFVTLVVLVCLYFVVRNFIRARR